MASYLDKYRTGHKSWLVYYNKGELKVHYGWDNYGTFILDAPRCWCSKTPKRHYQVNSYGKVIVDREEDIPMAKQMLIEHYKERLETMDGWNTPTVRNIKKMIEAEENKGPYISHFGEAVPFCMLE